MKDFMEKTKAREEEEEEKVDDDVEMEGVKEKTAAESSEDESVIDDEESMMMQEEDEFFFTPTFQKEFQCPLRCVDLHILLEFLFLLGFILYIFELSGLLWHMLQLWTFFTF